MRLRELTKLVQQVVSNAGGGGVPDIANRFTRWIGGSGDTAITNLIGTPDGSIWITAHAPDKAVLVDLEVVLTNNGGSNVQVQPKVRNPASPGIEHWLPRAGFNGAAIGQVSLPQSFYVPAGWEYTLQYSNAGDTGQIDVDRIYETPLA